MLELWIVFSSVFNGLKKKKNANLNLGAIRNKTDSIILVLHKATVYPHLEYCKLFWNKDLLEWTTVLEEPCIVGVAESTQRNSA